MGMALKTMESNKRVAIAQQIWKKGNKGDEDETNFKESLLKKLDFNARSLEKESVLHFLDGKYREKILNRNRNHDEEKNAQVQNLELKLKDCINKNKKSLIKIEKSQGK